MFRVKEQSDLQLWRGLEVQDDVQVEHLGWSGVLYIRLRVGPYMVKTIIQAIICAF